MLIVLIAEKKDSRYSGVGLIILEYSRIVCYSELPIPKSNTRKTRNGLNVFPKYCQLNFAKQSFKYKAVKDH